MDGIKDLGSMRMLRIRWTEHVSNVLFLERIETKRSLNLNTRDEEGVLGKSYTPRTD